MKKNVFCGFVCLMACLCLFLATGCGGDTEDGELTYVSFPEEEILGASFYVGDFVGDAGTIAKNPDGSYKVQIKCRTPFASNAPVNVTFSGPFAFESRYRITATFPEDPSITNKPYRVYVCASVGQVSKNELVDANTVADYVSAWDSDVYASFQDNRVKGTLVMDNANGAIITKRGDGRQYVTVFMSLYFHQTFDGYYEFTVNALEGGNGVSYTSPVTSVAGYRAGDDATPQLPTAALPGPLLGGWEYKAASGTLTASSPAEFNLDLAVPASGVGRTIEFSLRNFEVLKGTDKLLTSAIVQTAKVRAGTSAAEQSNVVTATTYQVTTATGPETRYEYRVTAKAVQYEGFTGVKLFVPGPFTDSDGFTFNITLPEHYGESN
ncbi:MAG: hypothetical protein LBS97_01345 [Treponema sp.]|jgi:hypothetical protein|nr:hypothetical protein [Treponema sp.]